MTSIPNYMVFAHGIQTCNPRTVDLGNTLVIMNCNNTNLYFNIEIWYQIMILATSIGDIQSDKNNIEHFLEKINTFRQTVRTVMHQDICAFYGTCPNILFTPICGGFAAKLPVTLYNNNNEIEPTCVIQSNLNRRRLILPHINENQNTHLLTPFEKFVMKNKLNLNVDSIPKYKIYSETYLGDLYPMQEYENHNYRYQKLGIDEDNIGYTLNDLVCGLNPTIPKILLIFSCTTGDVEPRNISTPVPNIVCLIRRYIESIIGSQYNIYQRGGKTYIQKQNNIYQAKFKNGKLIFTPLNI